MNKCSNIHCPHGNYDEHATAQCGGCKKHGQNFWQWMDKMTDAEAERRRKKIEQDNKHRKGGEE